MNMDILLDELRDRSIDVYGVNVFCNTQNTDYDYLTFGKDANGNVIDYEVMYFNPDSNCGGSWVFCSGRVEDIELEDPDSRTLACDLNHYEEWLDAHDGFVDDEDIEVNEEFMEVCERVFAKDFDYIGVDSRGALEERIGYKLR